VFVVQPRVEQRHGQAGPSQQVPEVAFGGRPDPVAHVGQCLAEQRRPFGRPLIELSGEGLDRAFVPLHGVGHDRAHVPQAGHSPDGIGDSARRRDVPHWARFPDPGRHPGCTVQPDELRVATPPARRDQHVDDLRQLAADVVAAQRRRPGDHAAGAGVQQRRHLLLQSRRRAGRGHVQPGQQPPPRPGRTEPVSQRVIGNPGDQCLAAGDHVKLLDEKPVEGIVVQPGRSGHGRIMRARSDKTSPDKYPIGAQMRT